MAYTAKGLRITSVSLENSCDEEYLEEFNKGKILKPYYYLYSHETDFIPKIFKMKSFFIIGQRVRTNITYRTFNMVMGQEIYFKDIE